MEAAIDGWRQAARVYADGQPTAAEGMLRALLGTLRDGKEGGEASHPSIEIVRCAISAAMEACGTAVLLSGAQVTAPSISSALMEVKGPGGEASALIQLAVIYNHALQDLYIARYEDAAEWIDLALKKFFFFQLQWAPTKDGITPSPASNGSAKRARRETKDAALVLCFAAIESIVESSQGSLPVGARKVHGLIINLLKLRAVMWLVKDDAKLASKLLTAIRSIPSAAFASAELEPRHLTALVPVFLLAVAKFLRGKLDRALGLLEALKRDLPNAGAYAPALYLEGLAMLHANRPEGAADTFESCALLEAPLTAAAHLMHGVCLARLDKHYAAIQHFQSSLSCELESSAAILNIAVEYSSLGMHEQKLKMFEYLARSLSQQKGLKSKQPLLTLGAANNEISTALVDYFLAKSAYDVGNYAAAVSRYAALLRALSTSSTRKLNMVSVMREYTFCLLQTRSYEACASLCRLAILSVPWDVPLIVYLADAQYALGQRELALETLDRALKILAEAEEAERTHRQKVGDAPLTTMTVLRCPIQRSAATTVLFSAASRLQLRARVLNNRALILFALGRETEACSSLNLAVTLMPQWIEPAYNRALLFLKCKEEKAAAVSWMEWRKIPLDLTKGAYETLHQQFQKDTPNTFVLSECGTAWEAAAREMDIKIVGWWRRALDDERLQREARDAAEFLALVPEM